MPVTLPTKPICAKATLDTLGKTIDEHGFAIVAQSIEPEQLTQLQHQVQPLLSDCTHAGIRQLATKINLIKELANASPLIDLVQSILGPKARLVRSILFDKKPQLNWQVAWHQDITIAVQAAHPVAGFHCWSHKDSIPHVQPPVTVLENMLTARLHLDRTDTDNGALWVAPGSHRLGRIAADQAAMMAKQLHPQPCSVMAGDLLFFRPLLLHASYKSKIERARRIIHLEFSNQQLPVPLDWAE